MLCRNILVMATDKAIMKLPVDNKDVEQVDL